MPTSTYISLTNSTTTIVLNDTHSATMPYSVLVDGWAPAISFSDDPYDEVEEVFHVDLLMGATTTPIARLEALAVMLQQAEMWADGDASVQVVRLRVHLVNSALAAPVESVVLGGAIETPANFRELLALEEIIRVIVRIRRRALWLTPTAVTATDTAAGAGVVQGAVLASVSVPAPADIRLRGITSGTTSLRVQSLPGGYLAWGGTELGFAVVLGTTIQAVSGPWAHYAAEPAARNALSGTTLLSYVPTVLTAVATTFYTFTGAYDVEQPLIAVFVVVRNNTVGRSYLLQARSTSKGTINTGPAVLIEYGAGQPEVVFLGLLSNQRGHYGIGLQITALTSTGGSVDIDYVAICPLRPGDGIIAYDALSSVYDFFGQNIAVELAVDARVYVAGTTKGQKPFVGVTNTTGSISYSDQLVASYRGVPVPMLYPGNIGTLWIATGGGVYWRPVTNDGTLLQPTFQVKRYTAYRSPQ